MENSTRLRKRIGKGHMLSAINDLKVIDTIYGACLMLPNGDNVFTLIPRPYVIEKLTRVEPNHERHFMLLRMHNQKQKCMELNEYLLRKMMANTLLWG